MTLSVVMVTYNSADVVEGALKSIAGLWDELLVGDEGSTDGTVEMVKRYGGIINPTNPTNLLLRSRISLRETIRPMKTKNLGERKQELVARAKG
ncbi:glycosyltransferase, partial [Candidatus Gottesmanbacteria bacterium]|nr:glycosyltransferase [Candidatus Gottesmanbacteria bacterium]